MKRVFPYAILVVFSLVPRVGTAGEKAKTADELKWAKRVVADFLDATMDSPFEAAGFLSPGFAKSIQSDPRGYSFLDKLNTWSYEKWTITKEEMSPNGSEVIISGVLYGMRKYDYPEVHFKLRVARETVGAAWSIRYFRIEKEHFPKTND